jgi:hypothetical protein
MTTIMKPLLLIFIVFIASSAIAQTSPKYPFYVSLTEEYTYAPTTWTTSLGGIEQVVGEAKDYYIIPAPDGTMLKLPKAIARTVSAEEAAAGLIRERTETNALMSQMTTLLKLVASSMPKQQPGTQTGSSPAGNMQQQLDLIERLENMTKSPSRQRAPYQNRYEVETNP